MQVSCSCQLASGAIRFDDLAPTGPALASSSGGGYAIGRYPERKPGDGWVGWNEKPRRVTITLKRVIPPSGTVAVLVQLIPSG